MPSTTSFSPLRPTSPEPRLIADDHLGELPDVDRHVVVGGHDDVPDVLQLLDLDRVGVVGHGRVERVDPLADQADGPDVVRLRAQREDVAADVGVGLGDGVGDHLQGHVVPPHELRIQQDLVLLDGAAEPRHVDHARDRLERPGQHPVLHRLELAERVAGPLQHVADDLAGRAPGREARRDPLGQVVDHPDPVDHLLPGRPVVGAVLELALDVGEPRQRDAPQVLQPGHPVERRLQRDADQPLHLLGAGPGILGDHLDQGRRRVGVGLDVEVAWPSRSPATISPSVPSRTMKRLWRLHVMSARTMDGHSGRNGFGEGIRSARGLHWEAGGISWGPVERKGIEPSTSALRTRRSPN